MSFGWVCNFWRARCAKGFLWAQIHGEIVFRKLQFWRSMAFGELELMHELRTNSPTNCNDCGTISWCCGNNVSPLYLSVRSRSVKAALPPLCSSTSSCMLNSFHVLCRQPQPPLRVLHTYKPYRLNGIPPNLLRIGTQGWNAHTPENSGRRPAAVYIYI